MAIFHGTKHDDTFNESSDTSSDTFNLYKGGEDTVKAGSGDDVINMGASLDAGDRLDGGAGRDVVDIRGDYSAGLTFADQTLQNIEVLRLGNGFDYKLTMADGNVASGAYMSVDASALSAAHSLTFDASLESNGQYIVYGGAGNDVLTGGALADKFHLESGGNDTVHAAGGDDVIVMGAKFTSADTIDGGAGNDTLSFNGTYASLGLSSADLTSVETLQFLGGNSYSGVTVSGDIAGGATLNIDASAAGSLSINLTGATSAGYVVTGSAGNDTITGSNTGSTYHLEAGGIDSLTAGSGNDVIYMGASLTAADTINGGGGTGDKVVLDGDYSAGLTFGATTMTNVETLQLTAGHSYDLILNSNADRFLTIDGSALGASDVLTYDGSGITTGFGPTVIGGAGDDVLTGGTRGSTFDISHGGDDTVHGHSSDVINAGAALTAGDTIDAAGGRLNLNGDYSAGIAFSNVSDIGVLDLQNAHDYNITTSAATVGAGQTLQIFSDSVASVSNTLTFDGSLSAGAFNADLEFKNITFTGGSGGDRIQIETSSGTDVIHGEGGNDQIILNSSVGAGDYFDGGAGNDALSLEAQSTFGTISSSQVTGINDLVLNTQTFAAVLTASIVGDLTGGEGQLEVDASGPFHVDLDFTAATSSSYDIICASQSSTIRFAGNFSAADSLSGGLLHDTLVLTGDYSAGLTLSDTKITSLETVQLGDGFSYSLTITGDITQDPVTHNSTLTFDGSAITHSADAMTIDLSAATSTAYAVIGGAGNDTIKFAGNFNASATVDGGAGNDTLSLNGDYSAGYTFGATQLTSVEKIVLADGHGYDLATNDGNVAAGATLTVDASALTGSNQLFFDGEAETDGHFAFIGGAADDVITGGKLSDTFDLSLSNGAFVSGLDGNDSFTVTSAAKLLNDFIDGGAGSDTLVLNGDFSTQTALTGSNLTNIETLQLLGGTNGYNLTFADSITTALTVDASAAASLKFSGAGDTSTAFTITGSAGNDTITGGGKADTITGGAGADTLTGGAGADIFNYASAADSNTSTGYDTITDLTTSDSLHFTGLVPTYFGAETVSTYQGSLDADLSSALSGMTAGSYAVVTLSGGTDPLNGHTFLVVDGNGTAGYTAGADTVIDITNYGGDPSQIHFI